jgi:hypothetical protein
VIGTSDFNGDGNPDLVWQNEITGQVVVWYMDVSQGIAFQGWNWLSRAILPDWRAIVR